MIRALLAAVVCLAFGLIAGFYLGRHTGPSQQATKVIVPGSGPAAYPPESTGSRARTSEPKMPPSPGPVAVGSGNVPPVQPPPTPETEALDRGPGSPPPIGLPLENLKLADIQDTFDQSRGGGSRKHEATDIMAPRGTPVRAVSDGTIKKLFLSKPGGITIYQFDPSETYVYYYAHLDRYAEGLHEGMQVKRGDLIGYVGSTGDADANAPHLHFAIFKLGPEKHWWQGTAINPYSLLVQAWQQHGGR